MILAPSSLKCLTAPLMDSLRTLTRSISCGVLAASLGVATLATGVESRGAVPAMKVLPEGTKRPPVKPAVRVDMLEMEMRAEGAPPWVRAGLFRVAGVIQSIGSDGVLLNSAGAVGWVEVASESNGTLKTILAPGPKVQPKDGLIFLRGFNGKVGELLTVDAVRAGFHVVKIGNQTLQVVRFRRARNN